MGFSHSQSSERALEEGGIPALISLDPGETEMQGGERGGHTCPRHASSWALPFFGPQVDTTIAQETRNSVQAEEAKANEKARKAQAIADDAQKDLDEALPALDAALASLRNLNKNDVTEVGGQAAPEVPPWHLSWWLWTPGPLSPHRLGVTC